MSKQFFKKCGQYLFSLILFLLVLGILAFVAINYFSPRATINQIVFHLLYIDWEQIYNYKLPILAVITGALVLTYGVCRWPIVFLPVIIVGIYHIYSNPLKVTANREDKYVSPLQQILFSLENTEIYEQYYKLPQIISPEKKKNVIVIFAESFESNFADADYWGENLIPNLSALADEHTSVKGYQSINGTNWTIASNVATFCGIPLRMQLRDRLGAETKQFLPNVVCLPDLLKSVGYYNVYLKGVYLSFIGLDVFIKERAFDETYGRDELLQNRSASEEDLVVYNFGVNDKTLFHFAKQKLQNLSKQHQPFFMAIQTLDTHIYHYHLEADCAKKYGDIRDAVKCSDAQIADFVKWIEAQDFYENTVVLVLGDHLMMNTANIGALLEKQPRREAYNMIMQKGDAPRVIQNNFAQFDWGATILDLLGVSDTPQLGLGRSLLRNEPTLTEQLGAQKFEEELLKNSHQYRYFLGLTDQ